MIVSLWMSRNVVTIDSANSISEAAALMTRHQIRRLPVVTNIHKTRQLVGMISNTDIYRAFPPEINPFSVVAYESLQGSRAVAELMTTQPHKTTPDTPIEDAAQIMRDHKISALPVVKEDEVVGIITESDIFKAFIEILESSSGDVKITFGGGEQYDILDWVVNRAGIHKLHVASLITYHHNERPLCVVRLSGDAADKFVEDLWRSGHQVLNVLRVH